MALKGKRSKEPIPSLNKEDRGVCLDPHQLGVGWMRIVPENIKLTEDRKYDYREVKAFVLQSMETAKLAQLLVVIFDYGDEQVARESFKEMGQGLESEMPKVPGVGDESVVYELEMMPTVTMKIAAARQGDWLAIFTLWLFQDYELEDTWVKKMMQDQVEKIKKIS